MAIHTARALQHRAYRLEGRDRVLRRCGRRGGRGLRVRAAQDQQHDERTRLHVNLSGSERSRCLVKAYQVSLGNKTLGYDAGHYLVVTSPMPILCRTIASVDEPVLSMVVEIELALLRELVLEMSALPVAQLAGSTHTVISAPLSRDLEDAGARLLACLTDERRTRALARQTIREMLFLVLDGPHGDSLRALAEGPVSHLAHVLRDMNARFAERMAIGDSRRWRT